MCPFNIRKKKTSPLLPTSLVTLYTHARFSYIQSRACQDSGEVLGLCSEWLSAEEKKRKQQPGAPQGDMSSLLLTDTCFLDKPRHGCVGLLSPPVEPRNRRTRMLRGSREQSACLLWKGSCHWLASDQSSAESYTEAGVWRKDLALVSVSNSLERCKVTSNSLRQNEFWNSDFKDHAKWMWKCHKGLINIVQTLYHVLSCHYPFQMAHLSS